jgi:hypothetical protein
LRLFGGLALLAFLILGFALLSLLAALLFLFVLILRLAIGRLAGIGGLRAFLVLVSVLLGVGFVVVFIFVARLVGRFFFAESSPDF